jgi:ribosomal-protein-alanine N-acetyltransferase
VITPLSTSDPEDLLAVKRLAELGATAIDVDAERARAFARLWVARQERAVAGFLLAWDVADEVHLLDLVVAPEARRRGIGEALIEVVVAWAEANGIHRLLLDVADDNAAAIALYAKAGFQPNGEAGSLPAPREHIREHQRELRI